MQRPEYILNDKNQLKKIIYPDKRTVTYEYDAVGNLITIIDSALGTLSYKYDPLSRVVKTCYEKWYEVSYIYDPVGNKKSVTYPDGTVVSYNYNKNNWLTEVITGNKKTCLEYDKAGHLVKKILPNGISIQYTHNPAGRLTRILTTNAKNTILFDYSYNLDAIGNYLEINKNNNSQNQKALFTYDPIYRLARVKYPNGSKVRYKYDPQGNRLSCTSSGFRNNKNIQGYFGKALGNLGILGNKTKYSYDSEGLLIKVGGLEFQYDDHGNIVEKKERKEIARYVYDYENRLVKIVYPDSSYSQYTYDAIGRRIRKQNKNGNVIYYLYDGQNLIQEVDNKGKLFASYIYDLGIDHPICMMRGGKAYYYLYDHIGSVIALTDETGKIVAEYEYDAWGNITKHVGDIVNPFRFTGREWDEESGLYYYRARYYDPSFGRFISKDPVRGDLLNSQSMNKYIYVNNNPQRYVDPFGLFPTALQKFFGNFVSPQIQLGSAVQQGFQQGIQQGVQGIQQLLQNPFIQQGPFSLHTGFQHTANFFSSLGSGVLSAGGSVLSSPVTILGNAIKLTNFLPSFYNPNPVAALTSGIHTATSIVGGMFGRSLGAQVGATAGFALGNIPGAFVGSILGGATGGTVGGMAFKEVGKFITNTIATGGQNILNAIQTHVGGILFDKAADVLTDLEEITGAYWDDNLGQIILVGKKNGTIENWYLPRLDKDHLAVAIRAVFSGDNLGVSIDPPPSYLKNGVFPPDGTEMLVRYLGNTKDTLFGTIMFEADRLLKILSMGKDNITHDEVTSHVQGFQNELDLSLSMGTQKPNAWHRMWFVIENITLDLPIKESADRKSLKFGKAAIKVKAEYISQEKNPGVDPAADRFVKHFTFHFDDFAREFPILERLRELAKISAIAKYLKNSGKPVDLTSFSSYEIIKVPTPDTTPGITASKSKSWQGGATTHTQTYSLYGGVDFDFKYASIKDDRETTALSKAAQIDKPCEIATTWDFKFNGDVQKALAFPLAKITGNYTAIHTDFSSSANGIILELARYYDSFNTKTTIFGYGWELNIPYEISIMNLQRANSSILLLNKKEGTSYKYFFIEDKQMYFLVNQEREEGGKTSFTYDPQKWIRKTAGGGFAYKSEDGFVYNFDSNGKLTAVVNNNKKVEYVYERGLLARISDSTSKCIKLVYDQKNRVKQTICPDQKIINYQYDTAGDLIKVFDNKGNAGCYVYDVDHRLIKVIDTKGNVILRNSYDPLGRVVRKKQDTVVDAMGNLIDKTYDDNYRLVKEEDKSGNTVGYEYDKDNNLYKAYISDIQKRTTILEYDRGERIKRIINPVGHASEFSYDAYGNTSSFVDANHNTTNVQYDEERNLIVVKNAMGNEWKQKFDNFSRLVSITDPLNNKVEFIYEDNKLVSVITPEGNTKYAYDKKGRLAKTIDPKGNSTEYMYDSKSNVEGVKDALGGIIKC